MTWTLEATSAHANSLASRFLYSELLTSHRFCLSSMAEIKPTFFYFGSPFPGFHPLSHKEQCSMNENKRWNTHVLYKWVDQWLASTRTGTQIPSNSTQLTPTKNSKSWATRWTDNVQHIISKSLLNALHNDVKRATRARTLPVHLLSNALSNDLQPSPTRWLDRVESLVH